VPTIRELIESGRTIHERLEYARQSMEARVRSGHPADWGHLPPGRRVGSQELPEWYLRCFRTLVAAYGKESHVLRAWTDYLRSAREARPDLDLTDPLEVVRAGADDLAGALEVLRRVDGGTARRGGARPTITVGRSPP
jgi:hypothetical protein